MRQSQVCCWTMAVLFDATGEGDLGATSEGNLGATCLPLSQRGVLALLTFHFMLDVISSLLMLQALRTQLNMTGSDPCAALVAILSNKPSCMELLSSTGCCCLRITQLV